MIAKINIKNVLCLNKYDYKTDLMPVRYMKENKKLYILECLFVYTILLTCVFSFPFSAESKHIDDYYIKADLMTNRQIGYNSKENKLNDSRSFSFAFGGNLISSNRGELSYLHMQNTKYSSSTSNILLSDDLKSSISAEVAFLNFYSDLDISENFIPYFGLGVGLSKIKIKGDKTVASSTGEILSNKSINISKNSLAYQFGMGVNFVISNHLYLDLGYRYIHLGKVPYTGVNAANIKSHKIRNHNLLLGLIYKF